MNQKPISRAQQDPAACWSITDLFPSDEAWEAEFRACQDLPDQLAAFQGRLGRSAQDLLDFLTLRDRLDQRIALMAEYAFLRHDEDTADPARQAMSGRLYPYLNRYSSAVSFVGPELAAIPDETLDGFYAQLPQLELYRRHLTKARLGREHILSPAGEQLLSSASELGQAPGLIFNSYHDADMKFPSVTDSQGKSHVLTNGSYTALMESGDRVLREHTFKAYYGAYAAGRNAFAAMLNASNRKDVFFARARKYESALSAALQPVEVPEAVYHNLLQAVHDNLDKLHRYMGLRKKIMGLDELHMYDIYANMLPESDQVIPFDQAREEVLETAKILGEEYHRVLQSGFEERWMDIYENEGKRSGAYSSGCMVHPFVLLNHKDNLSGLFTLAHEMGHAMHSWLSNRNQPYVYADYVLFVAEVASTCNEALLMRRLLDRTEDKKQRAALINYFLEQFRTTLYRQAMFAEFELETHRLAEAGEALTAGKLCEMYLELNQRYHGPEMAVDQEIAVEWARIPHFYRSFYVYQYATGFSAAMALSKRILEGGQEAVEDYLKFLSGGCSTDPISLLKTAGVDVSTPQPVNDALALFGELIDELEELTR